MYEKNLVIKINDDKTTSAIRNDLMKKKDLKERFLLEQKEIEEWYCIESQVIEEKMKLLKLQQEELRLEKGRRILKARELLKN